MSMLMRPKSPLARRLAMAVPALLMAAILVARLVAQPMAQPTTRAATQATLLLLNGRVITVDGAERVTQAVAIAGDRILAVGTTAEMERLAAPGAQRIDLKGLTVTPGLLDAHAHVSGSGADRLFVVDLSYPAVKSMADVAAAIREKAATLPAGSWIQGRGWDEGKLAERRLRSRGWRGAR